MADVVSRFLEVRDSQGFETSGNRASYDVTQRGELQQAIRNWQDLIIREYVSKFLPRNTFTILGMKNARSLFPARVALIQHLDSADTGNWHFDASVFGRGDILFLSLATLNPSDGLRSGTLYPPDDWKVGRPLPQITASVWDKDGARSYDSFGDITTHLVNAPEAPRGLYAFGTGTGSKGTLHIQGLDVNNDRAIAALGVGWEPDAVRLRGGPLGKRLMLIHWQYALDKVARGDLSSELMVRLLVTTRDDFVPEGDLGCVYDDIVERFNALSVPQQADVREAFGGRFPPGFPDRCHEAGGVCRPID